ncbi:zinc-dependent alcohol dehydrogenase family protein [Rhodovibrionaceae bacterium A322]
MRAYEIQSDGGVDALALVERPSPQPGPGQILVRMKASALNYRDLSTVEQPVGRGFDYPRVPNSDGAGEVIAVGANVTAHKVGDRIVGCFFGDWAAGPISAYAMSTALGGAADGVLAEEVIFNSDAVVPVPDHMSYEEAATLPCAALTAWNCLVEQGGMKAGTTVLLIGTGGVSIFGLQLAAMMGAQAIVISSSNEKLARAKEMGAWQGINYRENPEWQEKVKELTGGLGVDVVLETGGGGTLERSIEAVKVGGTISLIGILTGGTINPTLVMRKSIKLQGVYVGHRQMFLEMNKALSAHQLRPVIDQTFSFDQARDAFHAMRAAGHFGKLVVTI